MNTMPHEIILENLHLDVNDYHSILEIYYFLGGSKDAFAVIEGRVSAKLPDKGYFFIRLDVSFEIADKLLYIDLAGVDDDEPYTDFEERIWLFDVQPFEDAGIVVGKAAGARSAEGVDQRVIDKIVDEEISIGDYVLTGGELPACVVADAVARMCPGVLSDDVCFTDESIYSGLLEYPQYTRPEVWEGEAVPPVLLTGHHKNIQQWRMEQSIALTEQRRPDLLAKYREKADQK